MAVAGRWKSSYSRNVIAGAAVIVVLTILFHLHQEFYSSCREHTPLNTHLKGDCIYSPLNTSLIKNNFHRLQKVVSTVKIGKYSGNKVFQRLTSSVLQVNTTDWRIHTPSGRPLTLLEVQLMTRDPQCLVPNVAHFVLMYKYAHQLQLHQYISLLSAFWIMKPQKVVIWYWETISGTYWHMLRRNITEAEWENRVIMVQRRPPTSVYGNPIAVIEHKADVMRLEAILAIGGAYFDLDVWILKRLEPLRNYSFTIGNERPDIMCNGVFLGKPNDTAIAMWHLAYQVFDDSVWAGSSMHVISAICKEFPELCHVEETTINVPGILNATGVQIHMLYGRDRSWNWKRDNYVIHLFYKLYNKQLDLQSILHVDNAFGDIAREILFGDRRIVGRKSD